MKTSVTIVAFENTVEMSIIVLRDMFAAADAASGRQSTPGYRPLVVATEDGAPVRTFSGSILNPEHSIDEIEHSELIIVSGVWVHEEPFATGHVKTKSWLADHYRAGAIIACMHTGAFLVAETGLLDNRPATVFWRLAEAFRRRFPQVILRADRNITSADRLYCSSGIGSGLQMGIFLIEQLYGMAVAEKVSQNFLMDMDRKSRALPRTLDPYKQHADEKILAAQTWLEWNFSSEFLLEEVAERVGLGLRTFARRFQRATGETAVHYLQRLRIENAKELLQSGNLTIDQIAFRVGYKDATHFGRLFKRLTNATPGEFRSGRGGSAV